MRVLVTGANGQLGHDVVKVFSTTHEVFGYGHSELDISNQEQVLDIVNDIRPDVIVHSAAYTAVDKAEEDVDTAYLVNATGSKNIANASVQVGAKLCAISTDYVFDGEAQAPYREDAEPSPRSVYGASKLEGENLIGQITSKYFIVRTSWVFGAHGNNFVKTMLSIARQHKPLRVVDDQVGSPTYTMDLARLLLDLSESEKFGIYHATNSGSCSWYQFAREIFQQSGLTVDLTPCSTEEFPRPAPRPKYSVLDNGVLTRNGFPLLPPWQDALRDFLMEIK